MKTCILIIVTAALCCGQMCGAPAQPADSGFITKEEVLNLPAGDAVGDEFNGRQYRYVSSVIESCECTRDSISFETPCEAFTAIPVDPGLVKQIVQQAGSMGLINLVIDPATGQLEEKPPGTTDPFLTSPGTLNANGTFRLGGVGAILNQMSGEVMGEQVLLVEGRLVGDLMILNGRQHGYARQGDLFNDCQYVVSDTFVRIK